MGCQAVPGSLGQWDHVQRQQVGLLTGNGKDESFGRHLTVFVEVVQEIFGKAPQTSINPIPSGNTTALILPRPPLATTS